MTPYYNWIIHPRFGMPFRLVPSIELGTLRTIQESQGLGQVQGILDALSHDDATAAAIYDHLKGRSTRMSRPMGPLDPSEWEELRKALIRGDYIMAAFASGVIKDDPYPDVPDGDQPRKFTMSDTGHAFLFSSENIAMKHDKNVDRYYMYNDTTPNATIGIGHLVHLGAINGTHPAEAQYVDGITRAQAMALFAYDVPHYAQPVANAVNTRLNQYQFDALVSFTYNIGVGGFRGSGVLKCLNTWRHDDVPAEMMKWVKNKELTERREREAHLFETGDYGTLKTAPF